MPVRATLAVMLAAPLVFLAIAALGGRAGAGGAGAGIPGAAAADTTRPAISRRCEQVYAAWDCAVSWTTPPDLRPAPGQYRLLYSIGGGPAVRPSTAFPADNRRHLITGIPPGSTVSVTVYPEAPAPGLATPAAYTLRAHRSQLRFTTGPVERAADRVELGRVPLEIECRRGGVGTDDAANFRCTLTAGFPAVLPTATSVQYELWYSVGDGDPAKHGVQTAVTFPGAGNSAVPANRPRLLGHSGAGLQRGGHRRDRPRSHRRRPGRGERQRRRERGTREQAAGPPHPGGPRWAR